MAQYLCNVRAATDVTPGSLPAWQYVLVPLSTAQPPVAVPVAFSPPQPATAAAADATVSLYVDPAQLAVGTTAATIVIDFSPVKGNPARAATINDPELDVVICAAGVVVQPGVPAPARLSITLLGVRGDAVGDLPDKLTIVASLPKSDYRSTKLSVEIQADGVARISLRVAPVDGPPSIAQAAMVDAGPLQMLPIYTIDPGPATNGPDLGLSMSTHDASKPVHALEQLSMPWSPDSEPPVLAVAPGGGPVDLRYAVSVIRADGSESSVGATSPPVAATIGSAVKVTAPPAPAGVTEFANWRLYRSRLVGGGWGPWLQVAATLAPSASFSELLALNDPAGPGDEPWQLTLGHNGPLTAPKELDLVLHGSIWDDSLVAVTGSSDASTELDVTFGAPAHFGLAWQPVRRSTGPIAACWGTDTPSRAVDFTLSTPRAGTHTHVATPSLPEFVRTRLALDDPGTLFWVVWEAATPIDLSADAAVSASLALPSASVGGLPATFTAAGRFTGASGPPTLLGWQADGASGALTVRVREVPSGGGDPIWTDVELASLPLLVGASLLLPATGGGHLNVTGGQWDAPPGPAKVPAGAPVITGVALADALGQLVLHRRSTSDPSPPVPGPGPGPGTSAAIATDDSGLAALRARIDALTRLVLDLPAVPAGELQAWMRLERQGNDRALRLQLHSDSAVNDTHSTQQIRVRDCGVIDLALHASAARLRVDIGADAEPLLGVRLWAEAGEPATDPAHPIATHPNGTARMITLDGIQPTTSVDLRGLAADGSDGPLRAQLNTPVPANERARLGLVQRDQTPTVNTSWLAADATLNTETALVVGDGGTLGAGSRVEAGNLVIVDPTAAFAAGWVARPASVAGWAANGQVVTVASSTELHVRPPTGVAPVANVGDWYAVGGQAGDTGLRVRTDGAGARLRLGVAAGAHGALGGVTANPQLRSRNDELDAFAGLTVRLPALVSADVSAWSGDGEKLRLLGPMQVPDPSLALTPSPAPAWTRVGASQTARANTSMLAVIHRPTSAGCLPSDHPELDRGLDPVNARLLTLPDTVALLLGGGIGAEVSMPGATGRIRLESLLRRPDSAPQPPVPMIGPPPLPSADPNRGTERGYTHVAIDTGLPPTFALATGWRNPDMDGGVPVGPSDSFLGGSVSHWQPTCTRITATGGQLVLGRVVIVGYAGPLAPFTPPRFKWQVSDLWFMTLAPTGGALGELLLHAPASIWADKDPAGNAQDQALEVQISNANVTTRIFSVDAAELDANNCRRAAKEVMGWGLTLTTEIQMNGLSGRFAVHLPSLSLLGDSYQDDQSTGGDWWMAAYGNILGFDTAQFGSSSGTIDLRSSPFPPYWA